MPAYRMPILGSVLDSKIRGQNFGDKWSISGPAMLCNHMVRWGFQQQSQICLLPMEDFERINEDNVKTHYMIQKKKYSMTNILVFKGNLFS